MRFLAEGNARVSLVLCLMSIDGLGLWTLGLVHVMNFWDWSVLHLMLTNGVGLWIDKFGLLQKHSKVPHHQLTSSTEFICSVQYLTWGDVGRL